MIKRIKEKKEKLFTLVKKHTAKFIIGAVAFLAIIGVGIGAIYAASYDYAKITVDKNDWVWGYQNAHNSGDTIGLTLSAFTKASGITNWVPQTLTLKDSKNVYCVWNGSSIDTTKSYYVVNGKLKSNTSGLARYSPEDDNTGRSTFYIEVNGTAITAGIPLGTCFRWTPDGTGWINQSRILLHTIYDLSDLSAVSVSSSGVASGANNVLITFPNLGENACALNFFEVDNSGNVVYDSGWVNTMDDDFSGYRVKVDTTRYIFVYIRHGESTKAATGMTSRAKNNEADNIRLVFTGTAISLNKNSGSGGKSTIYARCCCGYYGSEASSNDASDDKAYTTSSGVYAKTTVDSKNLKKTAKAITTPTRTGYTFAGYWSAASGGTQYVTSDGYLTSNAITAVMNQENAPASTWYAHWTPNVYTITIDKNNANATAGSVTKFYEKYGVGFYTSSACSDSTKITSFADPTCTGHHVTKYTLNADGTGTVIATSSGGTATFKTSAAKVANATIFEANDTIYAQWDANTYYVEYKGNGATSGSMSKSTHTYGTASALTLSAFEREYTVTYDANGGTLPSGTTNPVTVPYKQEDSAGYAWSYKKVVDGVQETTAKRLKDGQSVKALTDVYKGTGNIQKKT